MNFVWIHSGFRYCRSSSLPSPISSSSHRVVIHCTWTLSVQNQTRVYASPLNVLHIPFPPFQPVTKFEHLPYRDISFQIMKNGFDHNAFLIQYHISLWNILHVKLFTILWCKPQAQYVKLCKMIIIQMSAWNMKRSTKEWIYVICHTLIYGIFYSLPQNGQ